MFVDHSPNDADDRARALDKTRAEWLELRSSVPKSGDYISSIISSSFERPRSEISDLSSLLFELSKTPHGKELVRELSEVLVERDVDPSSVPLSLEVQGRPAKASEIEGLSRSALLYCLTEALPKEGSLQLERATEGIREIETKDPVNLDLLTYNVWGLPWLVGGRGLGRLEEIGKALRTRSFGVVVLQEMWSRKSRSIAEDSGFQYSVKLPGTYGLLGNSGLVTLSKFPIVQQSFKGFSKRAGIEHAVRKGVIHTRLEVQPGDFVDLFNLHLVSPGEGKKYHCPTQAGIQRVQRSQIGELREFVRERSASGIPQVFAGDFNIDEASPLYEREIKSFGVDAYKSYHPTSALTSGARGLTVDPENNYWAENLKEDPGRLDYIFLNGFSQNTILLRSEIEFQEKLYKGKEGSDHYGVSAKLLHFDPKDGR